jgi:hypothetical protein
MQTQKEKIMGYFSNLDLELKMATQAATSMTTAQTIQQLLKHIKSPYELKETITAYRTQNPNWNWADAAQHLLSTLEGAK